LSSTYKSEAAVMRFLCVSSCQLSSASFGTNTIKNPVIDNQIDYNPSGNL
jgi:hypothetical protein